MNIAEKYFEDTQNHFKFLGIEGIYADEKFSWRILPNTFAAWQDMALNLAQKHLPTPRDVLRLFGYISRYTHVRGDIPYTTRHISKSVAKVARATTSKLAWGKPTREARDAISLLTQKIRLLGNEWCFHTTTIAQNPLALGFVALTFHNGTWNVLTQKSLSRSNTRHIDEGEAHAVSWAIDELSEYITTMKPDAIIIAIDNLVVSRSLLRGVSGSPRATTTSNNHCTNLKSYAIWKNSP